MVAETILSPWDFYLNFNIFLKKMITRHKKQEDILLKMIFLGKPIKKEIEKQ